MSSLSWNDLANIYDKFNLGRKARTLSMEEIMHWAESRNDLFIFNQDGSLSMKQKYVKELKC